MPSLSAVRWATSRSATCLLPASPPREYWTCGEAAPLGTKSLGHLAEERVLGWAGLASYSSRECYAGIAEASVYVDAGARGRGIGTALTEALAAAAEDRGFHKLIDKLFTDNLASIRLVERCGFDSVGLHRRHGQLDDDWRDVLVVERLLGAPA
jgi:L-amino acid N-acyltransferase YncA